MAIVGHEPFHCSHFYRGQVGSIGGWGFLLALAPGLLALGAIAAYVHLLWAYSRTDLPLGPLMVAGGVRTIGLR